MKKIYKIIASISVFISVLFIGVLLVVGNNNTKAKAGVIIEKKYTYYDFDNFTSGYYFSDDLQYLATPALTYITFDLQFRNSTNTLRTINIYNGSQPTIQDILNTPRVRLTTSPSIATQNYYSVNIDYNEIDSKYYILFDLQEIKDNILEDVKTYYNDTTYYFQQFRISQANITTYELKYATVDNVIASIDNIYDLENKSFCLLYLSDISGIETTQMQNEITINWGYIDTNDNTLYSEYAPTISAQNLQADDDTIIRLGVPLNNTGSAMNYYDISQKALLSTIDTSQGGATATAHIYGVYVWRTENMIEWGLAEFDTTSTPTSGASMNYLTSTTRLYQYQNMGTSTMTCRLSVSSNFNFITIKNQEQVDVSSVNAVIRQGGFLPAWALYNWARGSHSGFTSGEQYGTAQYQPGTSGYNTIYQAGYQAGINENIGTQNWFIKLFEGVDSFLNIRIFPNITFGVLLGIPFVIQVVWFIIRMFRGGGGGD